MLNQEDEVNTAPLPPKKKEEKRRKKKKKRKAKKESDCEIKKRQGEKQKGG